MMRRLVFPLAALAALSLAAPAAYALDKVTAKDNKKDDDDKDKDKDKKAAHKGKPISDRDKDAIEKAKEREAKSGVVVFEDRHRSAVRSYYTDRYRGNCPPGLAKKGNGCLPPGQAKKRYLMGHALDRRVMYRPVPYKLRTQLGPAPRGYEYIVVDGDVLKRAIATKIIVDAIDPY